MAKASKPLCSSRKPCASSKSLAILPTETGPRTETVLFTRIALSWLTLSKCPKNSWSSLSLTLRLFPILSKSYSSLESSTTARSWLSEVRGTFSTLTNIFGRASRFLKSISAKFIPYKAILRYLFTCSGERDWFKCAALTQSKATIVSCARVWLKLSSFNR